MWKMELLVFFCKYRVSILMRRVMVGRIGGLGEGYSVEVYIAFKGNLNLLLHLFLSVSKHGYAVSN